MLARIGAGAEPRVLDRVRDQAVIDFAIAWPPDLRMQPLEDLLNRIRWDAEFGKGEFAIGYLDRVTGREEVVPFRRIIFDAEHPGMFSVEDEYGTVRHVPLHRVRTVYKDGAAIWSRPPRTAVP